MQIYRYEVEYDEDREDFVNVVNMKAKKEAGTEPYHYISIRFKYLDIDYAYRVT